MARSVQLGVVAALVLAAPLIAQERRVVTVGAPVAGAPYSPAIVAGGFVWAAGQVGVDPATRQLVPGGIRAEARQALENVRAVLEAAGSGMHRAVKCAVFLADIADFAAMNEVYRAFFPAEPPARTTVAVAALPIGARIEVECVALAGR
jgi:2-iminobutanoate/2-iminopropanoate deaminase